jgi:putative tryptophan/tyrosine transport system substrate-binding protein
MRRRELLQLVGGAATWPLQARAQQRAVPVIGFLNPQSPDGYSERLRGFRQGLKEAGFVEGENVAIEYRWADGRFDRLPALVAELVRRQVSVIAATGSMSSAVAAKAATTTTPIVFLTAEDPVRAGVVASLARPGGNLTGINFLNNELAAKRLEFLRELVPGVARVAVLVNPSNSATAETTVTEAQAAAHAMGLQVQVLNATTSGDINSAFAIVARERPDALFVGGDGFFNARRVQLANLAAFNRLPATYADRLLAEAGGLMSYGSNIMDAYRQVGVYVGRILMGTIPSELPVVQASKFELVINAQTARMLGLIVPDKLLAAADEVIE